MPGREGVPRGWGPEAPPNTPEFPLTPEKNPPVTPTDQTARVAPKVGRILIDRTVKTPQRVAPELGRQAVRGAQQTERGLPQRETDEERVPPSREGTLYDRRARPIDSPLEPER
jgi:hypothetical protein